MWKGAKEQPVEPLMKKGKNCLKNLYSDADNFSIPFPPGTSWEHKALLLGSTLFIDYMMFEEGQGKQGGVGAVSIGF